MLVVSPRTFRQAKFLRFSDGAGREIYLLGTLHGRHLTTSDYSLLHLQSVQAHLRPDLLLIESRPEELARDNLGDGPIEMLFAGLTAKTMGVDVAGFDSWSMTADHEVNSDEREDRMFANVSGQLAERRKVLILTGYSHVAGFERRLVASGYRPTAFSSAEKQVLFDTRGQALRFPPGMLHYIQKRIDTDSATLRVETDGFWRDRLVSAIADRQKLVKLLVEVGEQAPGL